MAIERSDTTSAEYQRSFPGRHSLGHGVWSYPSLSPAKKIVRGTRYYSCGCGWRIVGVSRTRRGHDAAVRMHAEHLGALPARN